MDQAIKETLIQIWHDIPQEDHKIKASLEIIIDELVRLSNEVNELKKSSTDCVLIT